MAGRGAWETRASTAWPPACESATQRPLADKGAQEQSCIVHALHGEASRDCRANGGVISILLIYLFTFTLFNKHLVGTALSVRLTRSVSRPQTQRFELSNVPAPGGRHRTLAPAGTPEPSPKGGIYLLSSAPLPSRWPGLTPPGSRSAPQTGWAFCHGEIARIWESSSTCYVNLGKVRNFPEPCLHVCRTLHGGALGGHEIIRSKELRRAPTSPVGSSPFPSAKHHRPFLRPPSVQHLEAAPRDFPISRAQVQSPCHGPSCGAGSGPLLLPHPPAPQRPGFTGS